MNPKERYHHGNLKEELLNAAVALIAEVGVQAFTLREVARRAGVSHNAPYRHFQDKNDLLAVVAGQGFDRLTTSMRRAMSGAHDAQERFRLCGRGYLQFALRWPQHLQVMFDSPATHKYSEKCKDAGDRAFQTLLDCVINLQQEGALPSGDPINFAIVAWAAVHGLAKLAIAGQVPLSHAQVLEFSNQVSRILLDGFLRQPPE